MSTTFDYQPTLRGRLLEVRPLRASDFRDLYAVASDPLIWKQHPVKDLERKCVQGVLSGVSGFWRSTHRHYSKGGRVIESSRFHSYDEQKSEVEIGWTFLAQSHWGGIYNREMKELMLRYALAFVARVVFPVGPQNLRSQRAVEEIGGMRTGSRQDGGGRDSFV